MAKYKQPGKWGDFLRETVKDLEGWTAVRPLVPEIPVHPKVIENLCRQPLRAQEQGFEFLSSGVYWKGRKLIRAREPEK